MNAAAERLEFAPPPPPGFLRAFVLAVLAHLVLLAALTWGVAWKREATVISAEAELWSAVPQQAAPKPVEVPPPPPAVKLAPPPAPPQPREADIALEREKKLAEDRKRQQLQAQQKLETQKKLEAQKKQDAVRQQQAQQQAKAAEDRKKLEAAKAQQALDEARLKALREENLRRIAGLAGATGGPTATGSAQRSAGPSASYAGKIIARVKPNIVFTDDLPGNPQAEVEVRAAPDGTIVGVKVVRSSGFKSWDDAVVKALTKTETLPRDTDGRVPPRIIVAFRPQE